MLATGYGILMCLRQAVDIVMVSLDAKVLRQVDNLYSFGDGVLLKECLTLAVSEAEEYDVNLVERHLVGKLQVGVADEAFVNVRNQIACVAL